MKDYEDFASLVEDVEGFLNTQCHPKAAELTVNAKKAMVLDFSLKANISSEFQLARIKGAVYRVD